MNRLLGWFNIILKRQKKFKRWQRIVTALAAIMTFVTTYALILPAITVEKNSTEMVGGLHLEQTVERDDFMEENADSEKHLSFSQMMRAHESTPEKTLIRMLIMEIWLARWCGS